MNAASVISALDRALAQAGTDAVLRRTYGGTTTSDVSIRCRVDGVSDTEVVGGIAETDSKVIMSPSEISRAHWPGDEQPSLTVADPSLPKRNDKLIVAGRVRNVEFVKPFYIGSDKVRIELRISG